MKNKKLLTILISVFILSGCGPTQSDGSSSSNLQSTPSIEDSSSLGGSSSEDSSSLSGSSSDDTSTSETSTPSDSSTLESSTPSDSSIPESSTPEDSSSNTPSEELYNGHDPKLSNDGKTIQYGYYPQTYVSDASLISLLNSLNPSSNGWYEFEGDYYVKEIASIYNNESYSFTNGTTISNGNTYWFKCEPITWTILENDNGSYYLLSNVILDSKEFYSSYDTRTINGVKILANNYEHSDINNWLNSSFYSKAFALNSYFIKDSKVSLPSYSDLTNTNYGFDGNTTSLSVSRQCKVTDYAIAKGVWYNNTTISLKYNATYWTLSASNDYYYCVWVANSGGYLSEYSVDSANNGVRPVITITL